MHIVRAEQLQLLQITQHGVSNQRRTLASRMHGVEEVVCRFVDLLEGSSEVDQRHVFFSSYAANRVIVRSDQLEKVEDAVSRGEVGEYDSGIAHVAERHFLADNSGKCQQDRMALDAPNRGDHGTQILFEENRSEAID